MSAPLNFLGMRCPTCGDESQLDIQATTWIRVCEDGTDADASGDGTQEYHPTSPAVCGTCGHYGEVRDFERPGGVR